MTMIPQINVKPAEEKGDPRSNESRDSQSNETGLEASISGEATKIADQARRAYGLSVADAPDVATPAELKTGGELVQDLLGKAYQVSQSPALAAEMLNASSETYREINTLCGHLRAVADTLPGGAIPDAFSALAMLRYRDVSLIESLVTRLFEVNKESGGRGIDLTTAEILGIAWGAMELGVKHPRLADLLGRKARQLDRQESLGENLRGRIGVALGYLKDSGGVSAVLRSRFLEGSTTSPENWTHMYWALLQDGQVDATPELRAQAEQWKPDEHIYSSQPARLNAFERSVQRELNKFLGGRGISFTLLRQQNVVGFVVDFVLQLPDEGREIVIEADGDQYHVTSGPDGGVRRGRDTIKREVLEAHGLEVVNILSSTWRRNVSEEILSELLYPEGQVPVGANRSPNAGDSLAESQVLSQFA